MFNILKWVEKGSDLKNIGIYICSLRTEKKNWNIRKLVDQSSKISFSYHPLSSTYMVLSTDFSVIGCQKSLSNHMN